MLRFITIPRYSIFDLAGLLLAVAITPLLGYPAVALFVAVWFFLGLCLESAVK